MSETADKLLDAAEARMRKAGYNAVSFREIASDVGVKSASVHYHFPTKEALGIALVKRYHTRFFDAFERATPVETPPKKQLAAFIQLYREALKIGESVCLCCMLGAEAMGLPRAVSREVGVFFKTSIEIIERILKEAGTTDAGAKARQVVIGLEGAMIVAASLEDRSIFEAQADALLAII